MRLQTWVVLLALFAGRSALADESEVEEAVRAFELIQNWRVEEARPLIEALVNKAPESPVVKAVHASFVTHLGDYATATKLFDEARTLGVPPGLLLDAEAAKRARDVTRDYVEFVSPHFLIRYPPGKDALLISFAVDALEKARARIGELFGWMPKERVVVEIYPTAKTLAAVSSLTPEDIENSGTIALCRWNRLMITTPRAVVFGYAWRDTLAHELTHLIIGGASKNTVPIWLHEGLAKYAETAWRDEPGLGISVEQQKTLREAANDGSLIAFDAMHPSMAKLPTQEATSLAFTEVFTFIEYLVQKEGWEGIRQTLRQMAGGLSTENALAAVYGSPFSKLEADWKKTLPDRPIRKPPVLRATKGDRKLVIKDNPDTPADELEGLSKLARRYTRAADLLYARRRLVAAQRELERAFANSKSPIVSAKLATLALANNDLEKAEQAARQSIEARPELAGPNVTLAEILLKRGQKSDMALPLERALDVNPFDPRIHRLRVQSGQFDRTQAEEALGWATGALRAATPLGAGSRLQVSGPPFHRFLIAQAGQIRSISRVSGSAFELEEGQYEVLSIPPAGKPLQKKVSVNAGETTEVRF